MITLFGKEFSPVELKKHIGDLSQIAEVLPFALTEGNQAGCRGVIMRNAAGVQLSVLTDRGMSILDLSLDGIPFAYRSPVGPVHPSFYQPEGTAWLKSWPGGFLTPCGLTNVGSPGIDQGKAYGLHGPVANIPAKNVSSGIRKVGKGDDLELFVQGSVQQVEVFGENLVLERTIVLPLTGRGLKIKDALVNNGFESLSFQLLQHFNLGFPLVDKETRLFVDSERVDPRNSWAEKNIESWNTFGVPEEKTEEQVFYHQCRSNSKGKSEVALINSAFRNYEGLALSLAFSPEEYPLLVEWKMMQQGMFVCGLEPSTNRVDGRSVERAAGRLQAIEPGEVRSFTVEVQFLHGKEEVSPLLNSLLH